MEKKIGDDIDERLTKAIHAAIEQQIAEKNPPDTLIAYERLLEEGFSHDEAYALIGHLVGMEIAEEIRGEGGLNMDRYIAALEELPAPFAKPRREDNVY
ncbi:MAG: hypothetical protein HN945_09070 [Deltaproteobacteria bacterium]|nr:hypothetical protein [Deltaproteobacteria bacterium]